MYYMVYIRMDTTRVWSCTRWRCVFGAICLSADFVDSRYIVM